MSKMIELIKAFIATVRSKDELDVKYLSEANDTCDLERRMRELDLRARDASNGLIWGHRAW